MYFINIKKIIKLDKLKLYININTKFINKFYKSSINLLYLKAYKIIDFYKFIINIYKKKFCIDKYYNKASI